MSTPTLRANPDIVIVDVEGGETSKPTTIHYEKKPTDEIWERTGGSSWSGPSFSKGSGLTPGEAEVFDYTKLLKPGDTYEVGLYENGHGPRTRNPIPLVNLTVYCLRKKPENRDLIRDQNLTFGGTWSSHQVHTIVPTSILALAVSRTRPLMHPVLGIPLPVEPDGTLPQESPVTYVDDHRADFDTILPGNHYFYSVVVVDQFGNWDWNSASRTPDTREFDALKRRMDIKFTKVHILDDGGAFSGDEADFEFRVYTGSPRDPKIVEEFSHHEDEIDTGNEYSVGVAHVGLPVVVSRAEMDVRVHSEATESGGTSDEHAKSRDETLPFPLGPSERVPIPRTFVMDCFPNGGDSFHYNVSVEWSVDYMA